MLNNMVTIDWDYFIPEKMEYDFGHMENNFFINNIWHSRYVTFNVDLIKEMKLNDEVNTFWDYLKTKFEFNSNLKLYVTESHMSAYNIIKDNNIDVIYNYDAHCDLGYKGYKFLPYSEYIDCSNWLGLDLYNKIIKKGNLIYGPHTLENKNNFNDITSKFKNKFNYLNKDFETKDKIPLSVIHICRSGCWCPPWLDSDFEKFINKSNIKNITNEITKREWDQQKMQRERNDFLMQLEKMKKGLIKEE